MSWFPRSIWRYAVLIVLLLVLAAIASMAIISSITAFVSDVRQGTARALPDELLERVAVPILALTMGFLFLAGALGVWAIRSVTLVEGRRRVGRFVDAMDYLSDGLLAVDRRGQLTGLNPAARELASASYQSDGGLRDLFPCLTAEDEALLVDSTSPQEVERVRREPHRLRAFRFRSQPSEDMNLIIVSDVTGQKAGEMRSRQVARLQLIGRIARGVAHDFNNILTVVSGHASVLRRHNAPEDDSLKAIVRESQRGAALAGQLLDLSRTGVRGKPCERMAEHAEKAAELLRVGLSAGWQVVTDFGGDDVTLPLTNVQLEQVIVNLGLLVADELGTPGFVHIRVRPPGGEPLLDVGESFAAVILVAAYGSLPGVPATAAQLEPQTTAAEAGVIQSVVRSMIEEVGGRFEVLIAPGGRHSYRCCLPVPATETRVSALSGVPEELRAYVSNWKVLVAGPGRDGRSDGERYLRDLGINLQVAGDIVAALQHVEADRDLTAMIFDRALLGDEADALLRAILKLRPHAGLVVLCESPDTAAQSLRSDIVFEPQSIAPEALLQALIHTRELSSARK
jgi:two-component system, cell cycle sensor histidine kinase and response regulator CckA